MEDNMQPKIAAAIALMTIGTASMAMADQIEMTSPFGNGELAHHYRVVASGTCLLEGQVIGVHFATVKNVPYQDQFAPRIFVMEDGTVNQLSIVGATTTGATICADT